LFKLWHDAVVDHTVCMQCVQYAIISKAQSIDWIYFTDAQIFTYLILMPRSFQSVSDIVYACVL